MADYPGPSPRRCGVAEDILCLLAMGAVSGRDAELAREVCGFAVERNKEDGGPGKGMVLDERAGDEWLFGRAGFLWLLRFMRGAFEIDDDDDDDDKEEGKEEREKGRKRDDGNDDDDDDARGDRGHGRGRRRGENAAVRALIDDTTDRVIEAVMASPRPWKWHGTAYLGAVHGMTGILTQILLSRPDMAAELEPDLGALLSYQYDDDDYDRNATGGGRGSRSSGSGGNWPSSIPPGKDRLVQFCHGAPGIVTSLVSLRRIYAAAAAAAASRSRRRHHHHDSNGDSNGHVNTSKALLRRIDRAIARGRRCIMSRGLLTKEPCLCHGISGNGLALAASVDAHEHDHDRDRDHGRDRRHRTDPESEDDDKHEKEDDDDDEDYISYTQFEHFLTYTTGHEMKALARDGMMEPSDEPAGLYTGEAGRAWAWAVADGTLGCGFPGYNDL